MRIEQLPGDFSTFEALLGKVVAIGLSLVAVYKAVRFAAKRVKAGWETLKQFAGAVDALAKLNEGLAIHQARQQTLLEMNPTPLWQADALGRITGANAALLRLLDLPLSEIIGQGWESVVHPEDVTSVTVAWDEAIREKRQFNRTYRIQTPRETLRIRVWARPVFNLKNEVIEFQGTTSILNRTPITKD